MDDADFAGLHNGPRRNNELMRTVGGISQKMLTQTLRELERNGLIERRDYSEIPPRVDYRLTALGRSLATPIWALDRWAQEHFGKVEAARAAFDAADPAAGSIPSPLAGEGGRKAAG